MYRQSIKGLVLVLTLFVIPAAAQSVYVQRGAGNAIVGYTANAQPGNSSFDATPTPLTDPALSAWLSQQQSIQSAQHKLSDTLAGSISVTSTGTPSLNAPYAIDQSSQELLTAIAASIANGLGLPGGGSTMLYADITGATHAFTSTQILSLAKVARDYVYAAKIAALGQGSWPSNQVTIP